MCYVREVRIHVHSVLLVKMLLLESNLWQRLQSYGRGYRAIACHSQEPRPQTLHGYGYKACRHTTLVVVTMLAVVSTVAVTN